MKKSLSLLCLILAIVVLAGCAPTPGPGTLTPEAAGTKHLITDENGNYGGSLNADLYGEGAPANGMYDNAESDYWLVNDFYCLGSTASRTLFPHFAPYQQTMQDSSGLACALMILNYSGEDVKNTYNELALVQKYEELNNTTVYGNGTTSDGLKTLFNELGYNARNTDYVETSSTTNGKIADFESWALNHLKNGRLILVRYQDNMANGWKIIIGMDDMGTDFARNPVLIFADPYDNADHWQDGYSTHAASRFYRWWQDVERSGVISDQFDYLVVAPKVTVTFERGEETSTIKQTKPENHLYLNNDGSFGGTRDADLYGVGTPLNGQYDCDNSIYHKFVDVYNLQNTESRIVLPNYRAFQQTMASSCGICSTISVLMYYGYDIASLGASTFYDMEEIIVNKYEKISNTTVKGSGVGSAGLFKLMGTGVAAEPGLGFSPEKGSYSRDSYAGESSMLFPTYDSFLTWVTTNLNGNTPMPVSWRPHGGHWEVIIGIDTMGTDYIYDDVLILADSADNWDHYQDGYNIVPATLFYRQWYNGSFSYNQQYNIFANK